MRRQEYRHPRHILRDDHAHFALMQDETSSAISWIQRSFASIEQYFVHSAVGLIDYAAPSRSGLDALSLAIR